MEAGLVLIFWYGMLHAFGPDHLTVIADFSIGKNKRKTLLVTLLFAIGHGVTLFAFAKLLQYYDIPETITNYGDLISSTVIVGMGLYMLFMVMTDRIQLKHHSHEGEEHTHIWFGKTHSHEDKAVSTSVFGIGVLMGLGGVRGMLVTLGMFQGSTINLSIVLTFVLGVSLVFFAFGLVILYLNSHFLSTKENVRNVFTTAGVLSVAVGINMLF